MSWMFESYNDLIRELLADTIAQSALSIDNPISGSLHTLHCYVADTRIYIYIYMHSLRWKHCTRHTPSNVR